jgi:hypothetical protein
MTAIAPRPSTPECRPRHPERRGRRRLLVDERRSGFDRRRDVCRSPVAAILEAPVLRLRNDSVLLVELLILVNVLSALDLFITFNVLRLGATELNPVMAYLLDLGPLPATLAKLGVMAAASSGLWLLRRYRAALTTVLVMLVAYGSLVMFEIVGLVWMLL